MRIEITSTSVSKKGTIWIQAKIIDGETPMTNEEYTCEKVLGDEWQDEGATKRSEAIEKRENS